jgi:WD40 repeat protein
VVSNMPTTADHTFCPYKGLQPYTEADRKYFFGRTRDEGIIISNLYASSVTVFYGASGVGKSSVLLAGAVPRLRQEPRDAVVVVFNSWQGEDFLGALKSEIAKQAGLSAPIDTTLPLDEFLTETQRAVNLPLLLIFDQFEEYFLYHPPSSSAEVFESAFARAVNRRGSQVNFFLSLREDGLSKLDRFKGRIPALMNNMLRLEHLNRDAAKLAITQPLEEYNRLGLNGQLPMTIEPTLVSAILNDLQGAYAGAEQLGQGVARSSAEGSSAPIETPFLQMVMTRLWEEERAEGSTTLSMQTFERLGRAANIARTHLDTVMARLSDEERDTAANILRYLVTPSGTKIAQEAGALASWAEMTQAQVQATLTRLSGPDMRILRVVQTPGRPDQYEIFHDVLAGAILDWRTRYAQQQKQLEDERLLAVERAKSAEQLARHRARTRRLALVAVGLLLLTVAMVFLSLKAYDVKYVAQSRELTAYSKSELKNDPELSLLLAMQAVKEKATPQAIAALKAALLESQVSAVLRDGHTTAVRGIGFSPDGKYVVTASWDNTARVWEAASGTSVSVLREHTQPVNSATFSNDGRYILTASHDGHARVWEGWQSQTPRVVATLSESINSESKKMWTAAFSPDGKYVLTGGDEGNVRVWDWQNNQVEKSLKLGATGSGPVPAASPEPASLAASSSSPSESASPTPTPTPVPKSILIYRAAFSNDGQYIIVASADRAAWVWEWRKESATPRRLRGHENTILDAAFSPDGRYAVTASTDTYAVVWDLETLSPLKKLHLLPSRARGVSFSPDGQIVAIVSDDGVVRLWEWQRSEKKEDTIELHGHGQRIVFCVAYSRDGRFVATGGIDGTARIWRTQRLDKSELEGLSVEQLLEKAAARVTRRELRPDEKAKYANE